MKGNCGLFLDGNAGQPNYSAANLRGQEVDDAFNQGASAIMTQTVGVEPGLLEMTEVVQKILDKPLAV